MTALPEDAQERKTYPIYSGFIKYFPNAIAAVANLSHQGNQQHHSDKPLHWDMNKSTDEPDCLMRHLTEAAIANNRNDRDAEIEQAKRVAWRSMAHLERLLLATTEESSEVQQSEAGKVFDRVLESVQDKLHAELRKQYALDELLHPDEKPWLWWEFRHVDPTTLWTDCGPHFTIYWDYLYRRKDTAPNWDEELSVKEVVVGDDWPEGFGGTYNLEDDYVIYDKTGDLVWRQGVGFYDDATYTEKTTLLNHFKTRREAALDG